MTILASRFAGGSLLVACALLSACGGSESDTAQTGPISADPAPSPTPSVTGAWQLVWEDNFDGTSLDTTRWNLIEDCWGGGNNEQQCYTARPENVIIENGVLVLRAREESWTGNAWPAHLAASQSNPGEQATKPFTSGKITTAGNVSWRYGRIELRARLPQGQGTWPAFWMLPEPNGNGGWPASGEIDIMEAVNLGVECASCEQGGENSVLGTLHFGSDGPFEHEYVNRERAFSGVLDGEFHTYGVIWEEGRFTWTIDGEPFGSIEANEWWTSASDDPNAPFNEPFHLIINLAIGGNWPENTALGGVATTGFPKQVEVDWVRVWQCDADPDTGRGCSVGN